MTNKTITFGPIEQSQIQAYAEASGDFNKIHLDPSFAQSAGLPNTIVHGMLTMGLVGEALFQWGIETSDIVEFETKFKDMVPVNSKISVQLESVSEDGKRVALRARLENGSDVCHSNLLLNRSFSAKTAL